MLSPADAHLVERDNALPGLALLLDPEAFAEALRSALPGVGLDAVEFGYLRYKPGTSCLSSFTLDVSNRRVSGYAKAHSPRSARKLWKAVERASVPGPLGLGRVVLAKEAVEVVFFPNDNKLKRIGELFDGKDCDRLLAKFFPRRLDLRADTFASLHYKPERRYVVRIDQGGTPRATLKFYTPADYAIAKTAVAAFRPANRLCIPRAIGHSRRYSAIAFAWRPGRQLGDVLADSASALSLEDVERTGAALAELHGQRGHVLAERTREMEVANLRAVAEGLAFIYPPATRQIGNLFNRLTRELVGSPAIGKPIHGDFYAGQVVTGREQVAILDLDEAVLADPAADLGLFIAHLERDALRGTMSAELIESVRQRFLAGYGNVPDRVDLYVAISLLQLAPHHFRTREPNWPQRTLAILERAAAVIAGHQAIASSGVAHEETSP